MPFTSWAALKTQILDALAAGNVLTQSYSIGGRTHNFRTLAEVAEFIKFCDAMTAAGGDENSYTTYAKFARPA